MASACKKSQLSITQNLHFTSRNVVGEMAQRRSMFSFFVHKTSGFFKFLLSLHTGVGFDVLWFSVVLKMNF